jgi:pimeloyl-ACP methyl ester carboxylesterase
MPGSITVSGGQFSISADFAQLRMLADAIETALPSIRDAARSALRTLTDPALGLPALLDPLGAAEVACGAGRTVATAGTVLAECTLLAAGLRTAATCYENADDLSGRWAPVLRAIRQLPGAVAASLPHLLLAPGGADPAAVLAGARVLAEHDPDLLPPGSALYLPDRSLSPIAGQARALARLYSDGRPLVSRRSGEPSDDRAGPPRGVADLLRGLSCRDDSTTGGGIDLRFVTHTRPDGASTRSVIVDVPGTKDWNLLDRHNRNVADMTTNLRAVGNEQTTYESGVVAALLASGVGADEPILLVGHSQGGLVAARLAADLAASDRFRITHLLTAGAPIGLVDIPSHIQVLSLENAGDVVVGLDAADNRSRPNQITVRTSRTASTFGARHSLDGAYLAAARDVDAAGDRSVDAWVSGAAAFLTGDGIETRAFQIDRQP